MSRDSEAKADPKTMRLYDKRIVERNIKKGLLSRKDYEKHLKSLEDIADKGLYGGPLEDGDDDDDILENEALEAEDAAEEPASDEAAPASPSEGGNNHTT